MRTLINFIIALGCEAQPLIDHLGLKRSSEARGVKLYRHNHYRLIVSGVGKAASASAVRYIAGNEPSGSRHIWLNIGIAGHAHLPKGAPGIAHFIIDTATGGSFSPLIAFQPPCPTYALACYDKPTTNYPADTMCDMESAGFFRAALQFSSIEFIHALKIASDNSAADINALDRTTISLLVKSNLNVITTLADRLGKINATGRAHHITTVGT